MMQLVLSAQPAYSRRLGYSVFPGVHTPMKDVHLDIVFTAPHPDDLEIGMGGTIAKLVKLGYRVGMVHMTTGEPTPRGSEETRTKESAAAAKILGVEVCDTLKLPNRVLMDHPDARYVLATAFRRYRPKTHPWG